MVFKRLFLILYMKQLQLSDYQFDRPLFKNSLSQHTFMLGFMKLSLSAVAEPSLYTKKMLHVAETHSAMGVKATEFGIVGEVIIERYIPTIH